MEGPAYDLTLLLTGELIEVYGVARYTYRKIRICLGIFVSLHKHLSVENVYVDVVCLLSKISVKDRYKIGYSLILVASECVGGYLERIGYTVTAVVKAYLCYGVERRKRTVLLAVVHGVSTGSKGRGRLSAVGSCTCVLSVHYV